MNKLQLQIVLYFVCATKNENDKITLEFYDIFMKLQKGGSKRWRGNCGRALYRPQFVARS